VTGRLSVVVPFEPNEHGEAVHMFAFMCFSSCVGSLNRKPCHIIFSLELGSSLAIRPQCGHNCDCRNLCNVDMVSFVVAK
jgi:hypothetical protein